MEKTHEVFADGIGEIVLSGGMVRMDLVDDAIAEERRKGREDRERASL